MHRKRSDGDRGRGKARVGGTTLVDKVLRYEGRHGGRSLVRGWRWEIYEGRAHERKEEARLDDRPDSSRILEDWACLREPAPLKS